MTILNFVEENVFLDNFFQGCILYDEFFSDLETGWLTVLTPCSKMREQVKLRAPSINTKEMTQKIIRKFPLKSIEHFIEKVLCI